MKTVLPILLLLILTACQSAPGLKVAASANMQFAITEIAEAFEKDRETSVNLIISSSGKLTAQIEQGAPFDIFISANMKYPEYLYEKGFTEQKPLVYGSGKLVLWTIGETPPSLGILTSDSIQKIAIPNPELAPYGRAALEVLKQNDILSEVESKLVYGESISQCNQFITTQSADIGFTALSVVSSSKMSDIGQWIILDQKDYSAIDQGLVILKNSRQKEKAQLFYDYIYSEKAQGILRNYGYSIAKQ